MPTMTIARNRAGKKEASYRPAKFEDHVFTLRYNVPPDRYLIVEERLLSRKPKIKEECFTPWPVQELVGGGLRWIEKCSDAGGKIKAVCLLPYSANLKTLVDLEAMNAPVTVTGYLQIFELVVNSLVSFGKLANQQKILDVTVYLQEYNITSPIVRSCWINYKGITEPTTFEWNKKENIRTFTFRLEPPRSLWKSCAI